MVRDMGSGLDKRSDLKRHGIVGAAHRYLNVKVWCIIPVNLSTCTPVVHGP